MTTIDQMMPVFFTELLKDGQIDRALAAARGRVRGRDDFWMPALYSRISAGRLWYTPGFKGDKGKEVWKRLVKPVRDGKLVPILGPRLLEAAHGASHDTARRLAGANQFPYEVHEWEDLPRVAEFIGVKQSRYNAIRVYQDQILADLIAQHRSWLPPEEIPPLAKKPKLGKLLALVGDKLRAENPHDAYRILAELPASVYLTTNFDPLMERALKANQREPQQAATRWRYQKAPIAGDKQPIAAATPKAPLVYHTFGAFGPDSDDGLVLTEDDYFSFLINTSAFKLIPSEVESALVDNFLLFPGFRLTDWHFRLLFRLMMGLPGRERLKQYCHVAVQLDPDMQSMADVEGAKQYLSEYFGKEANIDIFWGSSEEFLKALRDELAAAGELAVEAPEKEDEDEWDF
jgi:SIR2-like domain